MPLPTPETLRRAVAETGYQDITLEKEARLLDMLAEINNHPQLAGQLALKGGTALHVFYLGFAARISVDIDFNYIGALDLEGMQRDREIIDAAIQQLFDVNGYSVQRRPTAHAGGKWIARYTSAFSGYATLELDMNYMLRQPLFGAAPMQSGNLGGLDANDILVLDIHEVIAGKIVALLSRSAVRDLFDARCILSIRDLDWQRIKIAVLAIGASSRGDWRQVSVDDINTPTDANQKLLACLPQNHAIRRTDYNTWLEETITLCRDRLADLLALSESEQAFLNALLDDGEIQTGLLENVDTNLRTRIGAMPMLAWKAIHVRRIRDESAPAPDEDTPTGDIYFSP